MTPNPSRAVSRPPNSKPRRKLGAEPTGHGVNYCAWAPEQTKLEVEIGFSGNDSRLLPMGREKDGYFTALDPAGRPGDRYKFRLDGGGAFPDPASRAQPDGIHGPSRVVDSRGYEWQDVSWKRPVFRDLVIYETHIGTFTPEGTFRATIGKLPHLGELGVNAIEIMPIADFPGSRNWGYDGVLIYAPARAYGEPDDLRALVDAAHALGIAVILDVVYNHLGPDGNYLGQYSRAFFNESHHTPWGAGFNFDGNLSAPVRAFFVHNPIYWMEDFHIDGFRLDATHAIIDTSERHLFNEITHAIHERGGYAIAEDARNEVKLLLDEDEGGHGFDAVWADDFHHVVRVSQTSEQSAYFQDFAGTLEELISTLRHGWHFRGQTSAFSKLERGSECRAVAPSKFIHCISNHDQAGNRAFGERISSSISAERYRAISMLLCFTPYTPMLFMGQEWAASTPFLYFTEHNEQLGPLVTEGRRREFAEFPEFSTKDSLREIPDPQDAQAFLRSKLPWSEVRDATHAGVLALYTACLRLRNEVSAFRPISRASWRVEALEFGAGAIQFDGERETYLLIFDLWGGHRGRLEDEPFAQVIAKERWELVLSSNDSRFGGAGKMGFDDAAQSCAFEGAEVVLLRTSSAAKRPEIIGPQ